MSDRRIVVVHFHLFKNAGTSIERGLEQYFGSEWASFDKESSGGRINQQDLIDFLTARPHVDAVSSHQLRVPLQDTEHFQFLPVVFLRDPLDRIRSAYDFERRQGGVSPSSRAAESMDLVSWIDFHRARNSTQCRNFQTLALTEHRAPTGAPLMRIPMAEHLAAAQGFLSQLPTVGVVEFFDESWDRISTVIREHFPEFRSASVHSNATSDTSQWVDARLEKLHRELGEVEFLRLRDENAADIELYGWVVSHFGYGDAAPG